MALSIDPTVTDDRGATHPATNFRGTPCPDPDAPRVRAMLAQLRSRMAEATKGRRGLPLATITLAAVFIAGTAGSLLAANYLAVSRQLTAFLIGGVASAIGVGIAVLKQRAGRATIGDISGELLSVARCPACAYHLGSAPRQDGFVTCSECGAAWKAERVAAVDVPDAPAARESRFRQFLAISSMQLPSVADANGRRQVAFALIEDGHGRDEAKQRGVARLNRQSRWRTVVMFVIVACIAVFCVFLLNQRTVAAWVPYGALGVAVIVMFALLKWVISGRRRATFEGLVRLGICPACANDLQADGAGHAACTMCGAAWKRER